MVFDGFDVARCYVPAYSDERKILLSHGLSLNDVIKVPTVLTSRVHNDLRVLQNHVIVEHLVCRG